MRFRFIPDGLRSVVKLLCVALGYLLLGRIAFASSVSHTIVTLVVFGSEGLALAAVLRWGSIAAPGVFLGQLVLAHSTGLPWAPTVVISCINAMECLLAGWYARRWQLDPDLVRLRDVFLLIMGSMLLLQPFSAILGVGSLWALGRIPAAQLPLSGFSWWMGNVLGQCIVAPALLVLSKSPRTWVPGPLFSMLALVVIGLLSFGMFGGPSLPSFALALAFYFPLVVLIAVRFGLEGSALSGLGLSTAVITVTSFGRGPFQSSWVELDLFLAGSLTALALGALVNERRSLEAALRRQNTALEQANLELSSALAEVQTLEGLLPICGWCKQIRDDNGYWNGIEQYFAERSHVHFTHGICPSCRAKYFGESAGAEDAKGEESSSATDA